MTHQWRRLSLYIALGLTFLAILFPPFRVNGGPIEYGFLFTGPASASQAVSQASELLGDQGAQWAAGMIHSTIDFMWLIFEFVVIWGVYVALRKTVLRPVQA